MIAYGQKIPNKVKNGWKKGEKKEKYFNTFESDFSSTYFVPKAIINVVANDKFCPNIHPT